MTLKFLLSHNYYKNIGGESQVFENEVTGLREKGNSVILYSRKNIEVDQKPILEKVRMLTEGFFSFRTHNDLHDIIKRERPDIAIVQNVFPLISPSIYFTLSELHIPIIQAVYNYRLICPSAELYTKGAICERCISGNTFPAVIHHCYRESYFQSMWFASIIGLHRSLKTFSKYIDLFMVPDQFLGIKLEEGGIPSKKIFTNPNPFFLKDRPFPKMHKGFVLFVGRLVAQKGILTLLKAIEKNRNAKLIIIGQGELFNNVQKQIAENGLEDQVKLLGPKWGEELDVLIQESAAVIIPSEWYDNLPLIMCQANGLGTPVIASKIDGMPEYIEEGKNGFLFEPGNADDLAMLITHVLNMTEEDYIKVSNQSRTYAEQNLDYPNHYTRLLSKVHEVIKTND